MPAPQATYVSRSNDKAYDPPTLSDDEDAGSDVSRSTWASASDAAILGLVDGFMDVEGGELADWKVSRVGGLPSFPLASAPPQSASHCLSCSSPMPLLTQLYVPLADSALERVVYVFGCARAKCRKQPGSVRAFRANAVWVEGAEEERRKAEEEQRKEREKQERAEAAKKIDLGGMIFGGGVPSSASPNPFAPAAASAKPFALPSSSSPNPFGAPTPPSNPFAAAPSAPSSSSPAAGASSSSSSFPSPAPLPSTSTSTSVWSTGPSYPAQYINTMYEPSFPSSSSASLTKHLASVALTEPASDDPDLSEDDSPRGGREGKGAGGRTKKGAEGGKGRKDGSGRTKGSNASEAGGGAAGGWGQEGYEVQKVKGVDEVFLRFQERVTREGRQVLRYEHAAQPLPFAASSAAYRSVYLPPSSSSTTLPTSTPSDTVGTFTPSRLPRCKTCGAPSTFEYQLMPNLVSVLSSSKLSGHSSAADGGKGKEGKKEEEGVEFATVWVVACERECNEGGGEGGEAWREEGVFVEYEEE